MKTTIKNCQQCQKEFQAFLREVKRGNGKFCSLGCSSKFTKSKNKPEPNVYCAWCNKHFYRNSYRQGLTKSKLCFCSRKCKDEAQKLDGLKLLHLPHFGTGNNYRNIIFRQKPYICERCGYDKHHAAIIVHHKDRNRQNNSIENLEVLCACCHLIEHYGESVELERIELS